MVGDNALRIKNFAAQFDAPPIENVFLPRNIKTGFVRRKTIVNRCALNSVRRKRCRGARRIFLMTFIQDGVQAATVVEIDFHIISNSGRKIWIARKIIAWRHIIAKWVKTLKIRSCNAFGIRRAKMYFVCRLPSKMN